MVPIAQQLNQRGTRTPRALPLAIMSAILLALAFGAGPLYWTLQR
jgi:hypothetical protein